MEIHQLKTFVVVAREGSITRASERLYLSQPAVSAHIKVMEETLGITLFERTVRGMALTNEGQRILAIAEQTLGVHRELFDEANRMKGRLVGKLRLGIAGNWDAERTGRLLTEFSECHPDVDVSLQSGTSMETLNGIRSGELDAGFYNESRVPDPSLTTIEMSQFSVFVAAPAGLITRKEPVDWAMLAEQPWIYPTASICCGNAAENLFHKHNFRPKRIISIDRESVTCSMLVGGIGIGLLHDETAREAERRGEVDIVCEVEGYVRVLFAYLTAREHDPILKAAASILRAGRHLHGGGISCRPAVAACLHAVA